MGPQHGLGLAKRILQISEGILNLNQGTVYPALRRLEQTDLVRSQWERQSTADAELRPPRKNYKLTRSGRATLDASQKRYPLLASAILVQPRDHEPVVPLFSPRSHTTATTR